MGTDTRGFASFSRKRLKDVSSQGGKNANKRGLKRQWNASTASAAGKKSAAARKMRAIEAAKKRLTDLGYNPENLKALNLSGDDYLYYAGKQSNPLRREELKQRIIDGKMAIASNGTDETGK